MADETKTYEELLAELQQVRHELDCYKAIEMEYRQIQERLMQLEQAFATMPLGLTITDLEGKILYTNSADATMHGYQEEELVGQNVNLFAPPEFRKPRSLEEVKQWKGVRRESMNIRKDGSVFPVWLMSEIVKNMQGEPFALVTSCEDIIDRKRIEQSLRESEERYRALFESLQDVFFRTDVAGNIQLVSPSIVQLLGYVQEEATHLKMGDDIFVNTEQWQDVVGSLDKDGYLEEYEALLERCDGSTVWGSITSQWYTDQAGRILGIEGIIRDITERKQTEAELQDYRKRLEEILLMKAAN